MQRILAALTLAVALAAGPALGQSHLDAFPSLTVGQNVSGSLEAGGATLLNHGYFSAYRIQAEAGTRYVADLRSSDFDAYLTLMRVSGAITEPLASDDDGGDGTDARLRFRVPDSGTYLLLAHSFGSGETGRYTLSLAELEAPPPPTPTSVSLGETRTGNLSDGSSIHLTDGDWMVPHDLYTIELDGGQTILVTMDSDDLDSYLEFGPFENGEMTYILDYNDDGGEGYNARLVAHVERSGTYAIRARSFGEDASGRYVMSVQEYVPTPILSQAIEFGQPATGHLSLDDATLMRGTPGQEWTFQGSGGQDVYIRLRSDDFDAFLILGYYDGGQFVELAANDDAPDDGTNSLIEYRLPKDGQYVIHATSLFTGNEGRYTLTLD